MTEVALQRSLRPERSRVVAAILGSFLAIMIVDFITHALVLSPWWHATAAYWRTPGELFRFIPYAYASFLLYSAGFTMLVVMIQGTRPRMRTAVTLGAIAGALVGLANILAIYSVLPMPGSVLLVFPLSFVADFAAAGASTSLVLVAERPWRRLAILFVLSLALFVIGVIVQNIFFPTQVTRRTISSMT